MTLSTASNHSIMHTPLIPLCSTIQSVSFLSFLKNRPPRDASALALFPSKMHGVFLPTTTTVVAQPLANSTITYLQCPARTTSICMLFAVVANECVQQQLPTRFSYYVSTHEFYWHFGRKLYCTCQNEPY